MDTHLSMALVSFIQINWCPELEKELIWTQTKMNCSRNGSYKPENEHHQAAGILLANHSCDLGLLEMLPWLNGHLVPIRTCRDTCLVMRQGVTQTVMGVSHPSHFLACSFCCSSTIACFAVDDDASSHKIRSKWQAAAQDQGPELLNRSGMAKHLIPAMRCWCSLDARSECPAWERNQRGHDPGVLWWPSAPLLVHVLGSWYVTFFPWLHL